MAPDTVALADTVVTVAVVVQLLLLLLLLMLLKMLFLLLLAACYVALATCDWGFATCKSLVPGHPARKGCPGWKVFGVAAVAGSLADAVAAAVLTVAVACSAAAVANAVAVATSSLLLGTCHLRLATCNWLLALGHSARGGGPG